MGMFMEVDALPREKTEKEKGSMPVLTSITTSTKAKSKTVKTIPNFRIELSSSLVGTATPPVVSSSIKNHRVLSGPGQISVKRGRLGGINTHM